MKVEHYSFGKIIIDGHSYVSDVIIYPDHVDASWWRKEGHNLQISDLAEIIKARPDVIIVGTGFLGVMKVPGETIKFLESKGMEIQVQKTGKAVDIFNASGKDRKVVAALHLTC